MLAAQQQPVQRPPPDPGPGVVTGHPIYITNSGERRTIYESDELPQAMYRPQWRLSDFHADRQLYRSSTSLVVQATDRRTNTAVVLKLYHKSKLVTLTRYQVEREIRIHSTLRHPNVISLLAAFESARHVVLVLEWAEGGDLYTLVDRAGGKLSEEHAAAGVLAPMMQGLSYLHGKHVIHRDIKPENILLSSTAVVRLADFGLAIDCSKERPVTRGGTLDYMAPEVLLCHNKTRPEDYKDRMQLVYGPKVDVWALGVLAYELVVGRAPFEHESRFETVEQILYQRLSFPETISADAKDFISKALNKSATKRPQLHDLLDHPWIKAHTQPPADPPAPQPDTLQHPAPDPSDIGAERSSTPNSDCSLDCGSVDSSLLATGGSSPLAGPSGPLGTDNCVLASSISYYCHETSMQHCRPVPGGGPLGTGGGQLAASPDAGSAPPSAAAAAAAPASIPQAVAAGLARISAACEAAQARRVVSEAVAVPAGPRATPGPPSAGTIKALQCIAEHAVAGGAALSTSAPAPPAPIAGPGRIIAALAAAGPPAAHAPPPRDLAAALGVPRELGAPLLAAVPVAPSPLARSCSSYSPAEAVPHLKGSQVLLAERRGMAAALQRVPSNAVHRAGRRAEHTHAPGAAAPAALLQQVAGAAAARPADAARALTPAASVPLDADVRALAKLQATAVKASAVMPLPAGLPAPAATTLSGAAHDLSSPRLPPSPSPAALPTAFARHSNTPLWTPAPEPGGVRAAPMSSPGSRPLQRLGSLVYPWASPDALSFDGSGSLHSSVMRLLSGRPTSGNQLSPLQTALTALAPSPTPPLQQLSSSQIDVDRASELLMVARASQAASTDVAITLIDLPGQAAGAAGPAAVGQGGEVKGDAGGKGDATMPASPSKARVEAAARAAPGVRALGAQLFGCFRSSVALEG